MKFFVYDNIYVVYIIYIKYTGIIGSIEMANKKLCDFRIYNSTIISMALIGSFNTEYWVNNRSDIDILVLLDRKIDVTLEFDIEDELLPELKQYFSYNDILLNQVLVKLFCL